MSVIGEVAIQAAALRSPPLPLSKRRIQTQKTVGHFKERQFSNAAGKQGARESAAPWFAA